MDDWIDRRYALDDVQTPAAVTAGQRGYNTLNLYSYFVVQRILRRMKKVQLQRHRYGWKLVDAVTSFAF